jgi:MFS family permease
MSFWNRDYILLLIINMLQSLGFTLLMPVLPLYARDMGAVESQIGFLAASFAVASLFTRPFSGIIADSVERKKLLLICQFASAGLTALLVLAPNVFMLILLRLGYGVVTGIMMTVLMVAVVQALPQEKMGQGIGYFGVTSIGSQAIAPAVGLAIMERYGYVAAIYVTAAVMLAAACTIFSLRSYEKPEKKDGKISIHDFVAKEAFGPVTLAFIFFLGIEAANNFLVLLADERGIGHVGFYFTIQVGVLVLTRVFSSKTIDRVSYKKIIYPCVILCVAGLVLMATANSFFVLAVAGVINGLGYGFANPTLQTASVRTVPAGRLGAASATYMIGIDLSLIVGSLIMGYVAQSFSYSAGFLVLCAPFVLAVPLLAGHSKKEP